MGTHSVLKSLSICLFVCLIAASAPAYWDEPFFLAELNDYENEISAGRQVISGDENTIFYTMQNVANTGDYVYQATRNPETGLFENQRILSELRKGGNAVYGTWMSEDNLRLYYCGAVTDWSRRPIWMAVRNSVNEPWQTIKRHTELESGPYLHRCSLTADEKTIMYEVTRQPTKQIVLASRNSIDEPFSDFRFVHELEVLDAGNPTLSHDGLTVYFGQPNDIGTYDGWVGYRNSLDEAFSNFEPIEEINDFAYNVSTISPSWDGKKLYVKLRKDEVFDIHTTGIYVFQWVDPPEVVVDKNLVAVIEEKNAIVDQLAAAIEKEIETLEILDMLQELTRKGGDDWWAIHQTKVHIRKALRDEIFAQIKIRSSIGELEKALSYYRLEEPARPQWHRRSHERKSKR